MAFMLPISAEMSLLLLDQPLNELATGEQPWDQSIVPKNIEAAQLLIIIPCLGAAAVEHIVPDVVVLC